jgi:hypothetical protein
MTQRYFASDLDQLSQRFPAENARFLSVLEEVLSDQK